MSDAAVDIYLDQRDRLSCCRSGLLDAQPVQLYQPDSVSLGRLQLVQETCERDPTQDLGSVIGYRWLVMADWL